MDKRLLTMFKKTAFIRTMALVGHRKANFSFSPWKYQTLEFPRKMIIFLELFMAIPD